MIRHVWVLGPFWLTVVGFIAASDTSPNTPRPVALSLHKTKTFWHLLDNSSNVRVE